MRSRLGFSRGKPTRKLYIDGGGEMTRDLADLATVLELTGTGLLLHTSGKVAIGEPIEILLPAGSDITATVVWVGEEYAACKFSKSLNSASLSRIKLCGGRGKSRAGTGWQPGIAPAAAATLGQRIKHLRKRRGYTMIHFANLVGVSKPTLWRWEKDVVLPQQKTLRKIALELGTTAQELLYGFPAQSD